jgi:hypothetical protein
MNEFDQFAKPYIKGTILHTLRGWFCLSFSRQSVAIITTSTNRGIFTRYTTPRVTSKESVPLYGRFWHWFFGMGAFLRP